MRVRVLRSELTAESCENVVRARTQPDRGWFSDLALSRAILYRPSDRGLRLRLRQGFSGSGLAPVFHVSFRPMTSGTDVEVRSAIPAYPMIFMILWSCGVLSLGGFMIVVSALRLLGVSHRGSGRPVVGIVGPLAMIGFGLLFVAIARRKGREDEEDIMTFLSQELKAGNRPTRR